MVTSKYEQTPQNQRLVMARLMGLELEDLLRARLVFKFEPHMSINKTIAGARGNRWDAARETQAIRYAAKILAINSLEATLGQPLPLVFINSCLIYPKYSIRDYLKSTRGIWPAGLPILHTHAALIMGVWCGDHIRRDITNVTLKQQIDGLGDAGIFTDDSIFSFAPPMFMGVDRDNPRVILDLYDLSSIIDHPLSLDTNPQAAKKTSGGPKTIPTGRPKRSK